MQGRPRYFAKRGPQHATAQQAMVEGRSRAHRSLYGRRTSRGEWHSSLASSIALDQEKFPARIGSFDGCIAAPRASIHD